MTNEGYEKVLEDMQALMSEERKEDTKEFKSVLKLSSKKSNDGIFIKLGSDKDELKKASKKEKKAKKSISISEFLKPAEGERYYSPGIHGLGRGHGSRAGFGRSSAMSDVAAPSVDDPEQFPTLGAKDELLPKPNQQYGHGLKTPVEVYPEVSFYTMIENEKGSQRAEEIAEEYEQIVDKEKICGKRKRLSDLCDKVSEYEDNPLIAIAEGRIKLSTFSFLRKQDVGIVLQKDYLPAAAVHASRWSCYELYIQLTIEVMKEQVPLKEGRKLHLMEELGRSYRFCGCTLDRLYFQAWRDIDIDGLSRVLHDDVLELFANNVHRSLYGCASEKGHRNINVGKFVTYPLRCLKLGNFSKEFFDVVKKADRERRCKGERFIGVHHLYSALLQTRIAKNVKIFKQVDLSFMNEGPATHPVYYIYRTSSHVAEMLGDTESGLEHLFLAIMFGRQGIHNSNFFAEVLQIQNASTSKTSDMWNVILEAKIVVEFLESVRNGERNSGTSEGASTVGPEDEWLKYTRGGKFTKLFPLVLHIHKSLRGGSCESLE